MSPKRDGSTGAPGLVGGRMVEQSIREEVAATVKVVEKKRIADEESESKVPPNSSIGCPLMFLLHISYLSPLCVFIFAPAYVMNVTQLRDF